MYRIKTETTLQSESFKNTRKFTNVIAYNVLKFKTDIFSSRKKKYFSLKLEKACQANKLRKHLDLKTQFLRKGFT